MAYAPILDPSAYAGKQEAMQEWRRVSVAAATALQELANGHAGDLRCALSLLSIEMPDDLLRESISELPGVRKVVGRSRVGAADPVVVRLVEQLRQVKAFGELDGGQLDDYLGPVLRLIRGGRVELFAGGSAGVRRDPS